MNKSEFWLRLSFRVGAVVDALAALPLTFPALDRLVSGVAPSADTSSAATSTPAAAAALMWGWTVLLAWGSHKPTERRAVLLITLVPVLAWMIAARLARMFADPAVISANLPFLVLQFALVALFSYSLWLSHRDEAQPAAGSG